MQPPTSRPQGVETPYALTTHQLCVSVSGTRVGINLRLAADPAELWRHRMTESASVDITVDDLSAFRSGSAFVTFGEVMVRDTPADSERLERTRHVWLSMAGSEFTLAIMLSRLGVEAQSPKEQALLHSRCWQQRRLSGCRDLQR